MNRWEYSLRFNLNIDENKVYYYVYLLNRHMPFHIFEYQIVYIVIFSKLITNIQLRH